MLTKQNKVIIYAQDSFGGESAKTGIGFIRYGLCEVVAIVDKKLAGKSALDVVGDLPEIPIFASVEEAKKNRPDADVLLIGIAPAGGKFPSEWLSDIKTSINLKLNVVNGLHDFLENISEVKKLAEKQKVFIWDVRKYKGELLIANAKVLGLPMQVILTVGTDAAVGKMTVSLELAKAAREKKYSAEFVATGQTGMMISGDGIPIDAITGDFMAGAIEQQLVKVSKKKCDFAFVEGQGSILHPGWSGVTLGLYHGSLPHKLILCHKAGNKHLKNTRVEIESLKQFIKVYEDISLPLRKAKVVGIGLNTMGLKQEDALNAIKEAEDETNLPADDVIRNGGGKLFKSCLK